MKLSILIPAKDEPYLEKTILDILSKIEGGTEILVGLDGWTQDFVIWDSPKIDWVIRQPGIGQRAMTNELARRATGDYVMKVDAHVSFSKGFDVAMIQKMEELGSNVILAPLMGVLNPDTWTINGKKMVSRYCFDTNLVMQYDKEILENDVETMCLQGSCWMMTKENYFKWNICDETLGSWGGQAVELGIKAFLNGGKCMTTRDAFYGHVFRHTDADFPYDRGKDPGKFANEELKKRYLNKNIAQLIRKFMPCADWTEEKIQELCISI